MSDVNDVIKNIQLQTGVGEILQSEMKEEKPKEKKLLQQSIPENLDRILKGQVNKQDVVQTIALKRQINKFNESASEIIESIDFLEQDPMANLKLLILNLLQCAETSIIGKQQGKYKQQIVFQTVCKFLENHGKNVDQDKQIILLWLIEEIFTGNRKNLTKPNLVSQ